MKLPNMFKPTQEDKQELKKIGKGVLKVLLFIVGVKCARLLIIHDDKAQNTVQFILSYPQLEIILKALALSLIVLGGITLLTSLAIYGVKLIYKKLFTIITFSFILDGVVLYVYPEITINVAKAIFSTY